MADFQIVSKMKPAGDQPSAIDALVKGLSTGKKAQTFLGVTGSGKTFTIANVIQAVQRPTLVISHNKALAAQLYEEFKELFPNNAVAYFVSYYDYYQPEAYIPQRDIYIEKDASRNDDLDRLRLAATSNLVSRRDTIIVASVSCIFGLGSPQDYKSIVIDVHKGQQWDRDELLRKFVDLQYSRNDYTLKRGTFRVRGDVIELHPAYEEFAYRIELFGDEVERVDLVNPLSGQTLSTTDQIFVYPAVHYVMPKERIEAAAASIKEELEQRLMYFRQQGKLLEAQRLAARTKYDIEMILEVGYCSGIENYSRHLAGSAPGAKPYTLVDYFPKDFLLVVDESHATIPQIAAMYNGDRARKLVLVDHGFRLPSCLDNRPMKFDEFEGMINQAIFVSATPGPYELKNSGGEIVEQIIRPTGLVDPRIEVKPARGQVPDLLLQCQARAAAGERTLVTTLTKRLAEDLSDYMQQAGLKCQYLHSEVDTIERVEILRELRMGKFDVLIGVNLLREGLDLPEVSLVCILDADKEGFLRSATSLIQTIGRCARNVNAEVFLYADRITAAMQQAIDETSRRRAAQEEYNKKHNITPETIVKSIRRGLEAELSAHRTAREAVRLSEEQFDSTEAIVDLEKEMLEAAEALDFERAAEIRDRIRRLKDQPTLFTVPADTAQPAEAGESASEPQSQTSATPATKRKPRRD